MIASYGTKETRRFAEGVRVKKFEAFSQRAEDKLALIEAASTLADLAAVPGNRLEALEGDRKGQHSIRINDQYRVCFTWKENSAYDVEITDYH